MKRTLVTGGAGFFGSHLVDALLARGLEVVIIDDLSNGLRENIPKDARVTFIESSITDPSIVKDFINVDCVFHLAAEVSVPKSIEEPRHAHEVNVDGFVNILEAIRIQKVPRVVCISSAAIYGNNAPTPVKESEPYAPESPYGLHKAITEQYARLYSRLYGVESVIVRPFNLYGSRQRADSVYAGAIARFVALAKVGEQATIFGDGSYIRDFLSVHDAVRALLLCGELPQAAGETFNIGTNTGVTILEVLEKIYSLVGVPCKPSFKPPRPGDIVESVTDASHIKNILGWEAQISIDDGLKELIRK
jgi:UDP-glucose 4-epimerase